MANEAVLWQGGFRVDLGKLDGDSSSSANDINVHGEIVGALRLSFSVDGIDGLLRAAEAADEDETVRGWAFEQLSGTEGRADRERAREGVRSLIARIEAQYLSIPARREVDALDAFEARWTYRYSKALSVLAELGGENRFAPDRVLRHLTAGGPRPRMWHPPPAVARPDGGP